MMNVGPTDLGIGNNGGQPADGGGSLGGRLNLLLSHAGWDPDPWVGRLPRLLEPMGVVSHVAESAREAASIIKSVRIHIAVVDLGLPMDGCGSGSGAGAGGASAEEAGPRLLELLSRLSVPLPTVVVKRSRGHRDACRELNAALRLGAFAVLDRPRDADDLNLLLEVLRRCMARHYGGRWPAE